MKNWPAALQLMILGFYVAFSLLLPTGVGFWLDSRASRKFPLLTLIGLGMGTIIMAYGVYRMVRPFLEEARREKAREEKKRGSALSTADDESRESLASWHEKGKEEE